MDHKVKEVSEGNGVSGRSVLTWQWIPSEGSLSSVDSLASGEIPFSPSESQCSSSQKLKNKALKSDSSLSLDEESATELRSRRLNLHGKGLRQHLRGILAVEENLPVSYEELQSCRVKLMCSFGGKIMPRPSDGKLRYVGGETRIVSVKRDIPYAELILKLKEIYGEELFVKYQLPGEDLDALVSVSSDEDLENMMEEYDRLEASDCNQRLRVFLFSVLQYEQTNCMDSVGDFRASAHLYVDAVNGLSGSCAMKPSELGPLGDVHYRVNCALGSDNGEGCSTWMGESVLSPSYARRIYDPSAEMKGPVFQRMLSLQSVSNPPSAPQSAPSSPSFPSRPVIMNRAFLDPPRQNFPEPQLKMNTCENVLLEMINQDDEFSGSGSSSNKDLQFQVSESRKTPNYVHHEMLHPAGFHHSAFQADQHRMVDDMVSKVRSPRKFCNSHEQHIELRPCPMYTDSMSEFQPVQNHYISQPEVQRFLPQNQDFQLPSGFFHENAVRDLSGLDETMTGEFKYLPEQLLTQSSHDKTFIKQPELPRLQHDVWQGGIEEPRNMHGRSEWMHHNPDLEHLPQQGFQQPHCQNSQICTCYRQPAQQGALHKLHSFVEKQQHQDDPSRGHCKPYNPLSHALGNDSSYKLGSSFASGLGSAPSSPQLSYHEISDRQTRPQLPVHWNHIGAPFADEQSFGRPCANSNQQSRPFPMPSSPPLYVETAKSVKECKICQQQFRLITEPAAQKQDLNPPRLLYEEASICEGCYPDVQFKLAGHHVGLEQQHHCSSQSNSKSYYQDKVLQNLAGEHVLETERFPERLGKWRDWPSQQRVMMYDEDARAVDRTLMGPSTQQGELLDGGEENFQKEFLGNSLNPILTPRTFVAYANGNGYQQAPRRNYGHETLGVANKSTIYHPSVLARQSAAGHKSIVMEGSERSESFQNINGADNWLNTVLSMPECLSQEPENVADTFGTHSHEQILSNNTSLSPQCSKLLHEGGSELGTAQCQYQQDFQNHKEAEQNWHFPSELHERTMDHVNGVDIDSKNPFFMDDCDITCSTTKYTPAVLQSEGDSLQADSSKLLADSALSCDQPLTKMHGDDVPAEAACLSILSPNTIGSSVLTGFNSSIVNSPLLAARQPIINISRAEAHFPVSLPQRNLIKRPLEPLTGFKADAAGVDVKCEENFSFVGDKSTSGAELSATKELAEDMASSVVESNGSQEMHRLIIDEALQVGSCKKADRAAGEQIRSVAQQNLLASPTFSIQAWETALESAAVTKSEIEGEVQCGESARVAGATVGPALEEKIVEEAEVQCKEIAGVAEILFGSSFNTEEEEIVEVFTSEPDQASTHGDTSGSIVKTGLAAAAKAIAGGLQTIKNSDLEEIRELGSGNFGTVYHGKWRGSDVAIKRIKASCFSGRSFERQRLLGDFWKEANTLSQLHHPNVVAFYGVVPDGPGGTLATVTEYMVNGSLKQVLQKKDRTIDRRKRLLIAMDAAFGMEYLHGKNIVHFDLKCENLLVNMKDPHRPVCKVGDLGLSKVKQKTMVSGGVRGTLPWMAPELLSGNSSMVTEKIDVFSFGIVMWELLTGEEPYANMHYGAVIGGIVNNTLRPPIPNWCDPAWKSLMERCWAADPASRPSFADIVNELRAMTESLQPKTQRPAQTFHL
ncbi:hypothetical protein O6H91_12G018500 [Diphasiastrum complanatum]|uniref:Uncharacterized protein n=2 Tax=Diphasiastrum complanatum TaxID=34168 RepID=A0ACC2BZY7_DIPCM|nr:hypothetical protein O6H91_12G018500 [Diphasiastrum complanatum]KAJ7535105.1 hypothetical protein O6H91_12G018500 [Diphasiastrum complanatum]